MGVVTSRLPRLRLPKTKARAAAEEQQRKIEQLCVMFPMLDKDTLVMVLDANDGDISKTMEMFMPLNPAMSEEHQQRPLSRTGPPGRPSKDEMKSISELMRWASSSDLDTQYQAVRSLADLAMSEDQRAHIVHAGASKPLVKMLSADRAEVQLCALIAVANLALNDEGQTSLNKEGAIQPLIAMSEASDPTVQFHAARALANLAFCHEDNEAAIAERGLPALLALVDSGELMVQQEALAAIANLARNTDNQRKIVESGALASLANGELLQQGARCLANLSLNEANEAALVASNRADKLGPIMIAICAHEDVDVKRLAAMALANLAAYPSFQLTLVSEGVLSPVSDMLASGIPDIELQAARCLAALSQLDENKPRIAREVGVHNFIQLCRQRSAEHQICAATCLANLSSVRGISASWG